MSQDKHPPVPEANADNPDPDISPSADGHERLGQSPAFNRGDSEPSDGSSYHKQSVNIEQYDSLT